MINATANSGCGSAKYASNSASVVAAANAAAGTNASAAAALVARGRESCFGEEVATGSARGDDDDGSAARTGGRNAAMCAHSSHFSSHMTTMLLTDGNTQVFAAVGSIPASAPTQIQECVLTAARYPAAEQVCGAGDERLLTLLRRSLCAGVAAAGDVSTNAQSEQ